MKSTSLTIVSNACGTLWNLSARCPTDQQTLWDLGLFKLSAVCLHLQRNYNLQNIRDFILI